MEITLKRHTFGDTYTLGNMYFGNNDCVIPTLEDKVREDGVKVYGETAIPYGRYRVVLDVLSPKFSRYPFYMTTCKGKLPRLLNVKNFTGILIHAGCHERNTKGCILLNERNGSLEKSKEYFTRLMAILYDVPKDEEIYINIVK